MKIYKIANWHTEEVAQNTTDTEILAEIINSGENRGAWYAAQNLNTPPYVLVEKLRKKKDGYVSWFAAHNHNCPPEEAIKWLRLFDKELPQPLIDYDNNKKEKLQNEKTLEELAKNSDYKEYIELSSKNRSWYKISQAMFETFNLEDKIINSFSMLFNEYLKNQGIRDAQKELDMVKEIYLGNSNVSEELKPIIEKYGTPKIIPETINFYIYGKKHPQLTSRTLAAFGLADNYAFIVRVMDNINDFYKDKEWGYAIKHETQHFLKSIYEGYKEPEYIKNKKEVNMSGYYSTPEEIQSFSAEIAKKSIDLIKDLFETRIQNISSIEAKNILLKLNNNRNSLISKYLNIELKNFINKLNKKRININEDIKRKYYEATIRNFNKLLDKWVGEKSNELV